MLKDSKVKAKIFCMGGGKTKDVTRLYRYATRLNECNIRILENNYGMTYVVHNGRITLKSVTSFFKILYSRTRDVFIFRTYEDAKEGYKIYEFDENDFEPSIMDEFSRFEHFEEINWYNLILLNHYSKGSIIYDYDRGKILLETVNSVLWLDKIGIFLIETDKKYQIIIPRIEKCNDSVKVILKDETKGTLENKPVDECGSQLIGNILINFEGMGRVNIIEEFAEVEEPDWLPKPYKYIVQKDEELYMLAIAKEKYALMPIQGKKIKPLFYPEITDYMVVIDNENVSIVRYIKGCTELETIAKYKGNDIKISNPVLDIAEGCIRIPIKIVQERFLTELEF